jgi:glycosyltransferase involved in cell wall biosynthesis
VRLLMVSQFYAPIVGGEERMVETLSTELVRRGHSVAVATLQTGDLPALEERDGVWIHRIPSAGRRLRALYSDRERPHAPPLPDPVAMRRLMEIVRQERPEVIHGHNWLFHSMLPLRRAVQGPFVLSLHDYSLVCATRRFVYEDAACTGPEPAKCVRCAVRHYGALKGIPVVAANRAMRPAVRAAVDMFLPVSHAVANALRLDELGVRWRVVPNFLPARPTAPDPTTSLNGLPADGFLLCVGDLSEDKGIDVLLDAYEQLSGAPPLVLIGRALSARLDNPPANVRVLGPRPHPEVMAAWQRCGLGIVPSVTEEAFGLAALEAMAAGKPVIAAAHGGLAEVVTDGDSGLLVRPGDPNALRDALARLLRDRRLARKLSRGALRAATGFAPDVVVPQLEEVYQELRTERSRARRPRARSDERRRTASLGRLPALALTSAIGIALVSLADSLSRRGLAGGELLFWVGLLAVFVPVVTRLASRAPRRAERASLVVLLGLACYLVKVLRDPFAFTYADELVHQHNVLSILHSHSLFGDNPILPVTPLYPGLESWTAALSATSGLSTFVCGLIVIGVARIVLMLSLYLLYEWLVRDARLAGLAVALYVTSPHFLFFTAQFSYESLALPLGVLGLAAAVRAWPRAGPPRRSWAAVAIGATLGVVVTHHITSYALVAALLAICLLPLPKTGGAVRRPWPMAATAFLATAFWLMFVAEQTVGYLSPLLGALRATFRTAAGEAAPRRLFQSAPGQSSPAWEHLAAFASTAVLVAAIAIGMRLIWQRHRRQPTLLVLGGASVLYVATLALRLVPAAWETATRASEFLYVGVALVAAMAGLAVFDRLPATGAVRVAGPVLAALVLVGGVIAGTPYGLRVAQTYRISADGRDLDPSGVAVARWARATLGQGRHVAAQEADARFLLVYGGMDVFAGKNPPITSVLDTPVLYRWQLNLLRSHGIRYVVVDARTASASVGVGYYFPRPDRAQQRFPAAVLGKFERAGARRIYDSGDIVVDDIRPVRNADAAP